MVIRQLLLQLNKTPSKANNPSPEACVVSLIQSLQLVTSSVFTRLQGYTVNLSVICDSNSDSVPVQQDFEIMVQVQFWFFRQEWLRLCLGFSLGSTSQQYFYFCLKNPLPYFWMLAKPLGVSLGSHSTNFSLGHAIQGLVPDLQALLSLSPPFTDKHILRPKMFCCPRLPSSKVFLATSPAASSVIISLQHLLLPFSLG